jgi:GrpB-like predicted nucleotidyltransferase (UPF0157 family)
MLGLKRGTVKLVPHDPGWATLFEYERQLLEDAFGDTIIAIEHVGSTAITGIPAKPIIDINVGVESLDTARGMKDVFARLGYEHRPFVPGRSAEGLDAQELYVRGPEECRTHHVHVTVYGGGYWNKDILFRDYLREHPECAHEYADLKVCLAHKYANDRGSYSKNKAEFILRIQELATKIPPSP